MFGEGADAWSRTWIEDYGDVEGGVISCAVGVEGVSISDCVW